MSSLSALAPLSSTDFVSIPQPTAEQVRLSREEDRLYALDASTMAWMISQIKDGDAAWKQMKYRETINGISGHAQRPAVFGDNSLGTAMEVCWETLESTSFSCPRELYWTFHGSLRTGIRSETYEAHRHDPDHADARAARDLCTALYRGIPLYEFARKAVALLNKAGGLKLSKSASQALQERIAHRSPASRHLETLRTQIGWAPTALTMPSYLRYWNRLRGTTGAGFDPQGNNNLPYHQYTMRIQGADGTLRTVPNIRMGTPTTQSSNASYASIIPEFLGFLDALKLAGKRILIVSLQDRTSAESARTQPIEELTALYPETVTVIGLSCDGPFYYQTQSSAHTYSAFRTEFLEYLLQEHGGYFLPDSLADPDVLGHCIDEAKAIYFPEQDALNFTERQDLILASYIRITLHSLTALNIDLFTAFCRDGIDRAAVFNGLLFESMTAATHDVLPESYIEELGTIVSAPSIFVRKSEIRSDRLSRGLNLHDRLHRAPEIATRIRERSGYIQAIHVASNPASQLFPRHHNAASYAEYDRAFSEDIRTHLWIDATEQFTPLLLEQGFDPTRMADLQESLEELAKEKYDNPRLQIQVRLATPNTPLSGTFQSGFLKQASMKLRIACTASSEKTDPSPIIPRYVELRVRVNSEAPTVTILFSEPALSLNDLN